MPAESFAQPPAQSTYVTAPHQPPPSALTGVAAFGIEEPEPAPQFEEKTSDLPPPPGMESQSRLSELKFKLFRQINYDFNVKKIIVVLL